MEPLTLRCLGDVKRSTLSLLDKSISTSFMPFTPIYSELNCGILISIELGDYVFKDWNFNGIKDAEKNTDVPNVSVTITECAGPNTWTTATDKSDNCILNVATPPFFNGSDDLGVEHTLTPYVSLPLPSRMYSSFRFSYCDYYYLNLLQ